MAYRPDPVALLQLSDDALVARYREGDGQALQSLLERYRCFAKAKSRAYFLAGADGEDIEQEGMIGLFKAVRDFRPDRRASFRAFAELCITRQIITAVKMATRQKHQPLNRYVSISGPQREVGERAVEDLRDDVGGSDPAEQVVSSERLRDMQARMDQVLSDLEVEVLRLYVDGSSYHEIGQQLGRQVKSIDNALQRIKRKLESHLHQGPETDILVA